MRLVPQESYWTFKTPPTPDEPPPGMSPKGGWHSLSPGMRREIWRDHERRTRLAAQSEAATVGDQRRDYLDRKTEVQLAARHRL